MAMLTFGFPQQTEPAPSSGPMTDMLRSAVAYRQNAAVGPAVMQEAVSRLQSIGSDRARQMAQLVQSNPRAAQAMVADAGGWTQYVGQLEAEARERAAGEAAARALAANPNMQATAALARHNPQLAISLAKLGQQTIREDAAGVPRYVGTGAPVFPGDADFQRNRQIRDDAAGIPRYVDTGEQVFSGDQKQPTALTLAQQANAQETLDARRRLAAWMQERGHSQADMRRIITRGSNPFDFNLDDTSEDRFAAHLWNAARQRVPGEDDGWSPFMDSVIGSGKGPAAKTPPRSDTAKVAPLPADRSEWVDGESYLIRDPETGQEVAARYDAERGGFEF